MSTPPACLQSWNVSLPTNFPFINYLACYYDTTRNVVQESNRVEVSEAGFLSHILQKSMQSCGRWPHGAG